MEEKAAAVEARRQELEDDRADKALQQAEHAKQVRRNKYSTTVPGADGPELAKEG